MTAIQPKAEARFKDASEAEQALRLAWEKCLTEALVHPSVLAMEETPHDKAPVRMHDARAPRPKPALPNTSDEVTSVEAGIPAKAAAVAAAAAAGKPLVIEAGRPRSDDDDPTMLHHGKASKDVTSRGIAVAVKTPPSGKAALVTPKDAAPASEFATTAIDHKPGKKAAANHKAVAAAGPAKSSGAPRACWSSSRSRCSCSRAAGAGLYYTGYVDLPFNI